MRMARRFYKQGESHSWNLVSGNPASIYITHDSSYTARHVDQTEVAYQNYVNFCSRLGTPSLSKENWHKLVDKAPSSSHLDMIDAHKSFHKHDHIVTRFELEDHLTASKRGFRSTYLGNGARRVSPAPAHQ